MSRQGRRQPPQRRTQGRAGTPRRPDASRRTPRQQRPVPPPRPPYEDDPAYHDPPDQQGRHSPPGYRDAPGHQAPPGFRDEAGPPAAPRFRGAPGYQASPGFGDEPDHQAAPGYQNPPGYRDAPGHQGAPRDRGAPGYRGASGHEDEPAYDEVPAGNPAPARGDGSGGKAKKRGKRPKRRAGPAMGRPARPPDRSRPAARGKGPGPKLYFGAAAVLGLAVLLGLGAVLVLHGEDRPDAGDAANAQIGTPAGTGLSPDSYSSSPSTSAYEGIASRRADPDPLTIEEAFPSSAAKLSVPDGEVRVKLRAKRLDGDCAAAVWGGTVGDALGQGGCTQAARGIYADTENGYALAVAVFNLSGTAEADEFVATLEKTIGGGFVRPLEAPAPLDDFGRGFGMARGLSMGHFAVVTWAQRLDGKGDAKDETLLSLLIEGGKNPAVLGRAARASD